MLFIFIIRIYKKKIGMVYYKIATNNTQPTLGARDVTPSLTLLTLDAALVIDRFDNMDSLELVRFSPVGGRPLPECTWQAPGFTLEGDLLTFETGAKSPKLGLHSKYLKTI